MFLFAWISLFEVIYCILLVILRKLSKLAIFFCFRFFSLLLANFYIYTVNRCFRNFLHLAFYLISCHIFFLYQHQISTSLQIYFYWITYIRKVEQIFYNKMLDNKFLLIYSSKKCLLRTPGLSEKDFNKQ